MKLVTMFACGRRTELQSAASRAPQQVPKHAAEQLVTFFEHFAANAEHITLAGPFAHHRKPPRQALLSRKDSAP